MMKKFIEYMLESQDYSKISLKPLDEFECINLQINDDLLNNSKIVAYSSGQTIKDVDGKEVPINPKKFPQRAIVILLPEIDRTQVKMFLDTESKCWDSDFIYDGRHCKLSPEQFGQFFESNFYQKLLNKLQKDWPLSDNFYKELYDGVAERKMYLSEPTTILEADGKDDKNKEKPKFSASGRKIVNFNDYGVIKKGAKFYCWPNTKKLYNWSTWKDWKKIHPLCRIRFKYSSNGHWYGISISAIKENYKNRGFRSYDLTQQPPLQWLTRDENEVIMKLTIVDKFIRHCIEKIQSALAIPTEDILKKINNPDKITAKEIDLTKRVIRDTLNNIIKKKQSDSFKWTLHENEVLSEDVVIGADVGSSVGNEISQATSIKDDTNVVKGSGITTDDILGKDCDHQKHGFYSDGCFHMPKQLKLSTDGTKRTKKTPYEKGMTTYNYGK